MTRTRFRRCAAAAAAITALFLTGSAFAQYAWIDDRGVKQYSDMPPPASVPANRIIRYPKGSMPAATEAATSSPEAASAQAKQEMSLAEKEAEFRKRKTELAEKEKKATEEARLAAEKLKNCERTREYNRTLESGERVARTDKNGERTYLTDEQRAQELRDTRRVLDNCK